MTQDIKWLPVAPASMGKGNAANDKFSFFLGGYRTCPCLVHPCGLVEYGPRVPIEDPTSNTYIYAEFAGPILSPKLNGTRYGDTDAKYQIIINWAGDKWAFCVEPEWTTLMPDVITQAVKIVNPVNSWCVVDYVYTRHLYAWYKAAGIPMVSEDIKPMLNDCYNVITYRDGQI